MACWMLMQRDETVLFFWPLFSRNVGQFSLGLGVLLTLIRRQNACSSIYNRLWPSLSRPASSFLLSWQEEFILCSECWNQNRLCFWLFLWGESYSWICVLHVFCKQTIYSLTQRMRVHVSVGLPLSCDANHIQHIEVLFHFNFLFAHLYSEIVSLPFTFCWKTRTHTQPLTRFLEKLGQVNHFWNGKWGGDHVIWKR